MPLTSVEFHVLLAMFEGPIHGYAIMRDVEALTSSQLAYIGPGVRHATHSH